MLATEIMDQEIARLGELMTLLYPWDEDGSLSAVQVVPQQAAKRTTVNVTILNERGEKVFSDLPEEEDMKQIEGSLGER